MPLLPPINLPLWLSENGHLLQPPVNNFCLYRGGDFIVMAVGGPNQRNDYHVNETEEWFYQYKGDMCLKVVEDGQTFKDVIIKEGEMFLLPSNTPHNPCRFANTVGIVLERERPESSFDSLRWYCRAVDPKTGAPVHDKPTIIHQESFHVYNLGTQLKPVIERWIKGEDGIRVCKECGAEAEPM